MRLTGSRVYTRAAPVPKMPPGLVVLMEGLTKDVLRNNPTNVYEFCASHMKKLLELRDGPLPAKSLSLEKKISVAQEKVRQRAKERQNLFDNQNGFKPNDPEDGISSTEPNANEQELVRNLKAPIHQDQDLALSSEVEISHELTDNNSLTSKDSNFDESDDIPISKSSTFSSISKSTVIDLMPGNDHETNDKDDTESGIVNIETPKREIPKDEVNESDKSQEDDISKKKVTEIPMIEINSSDPVIEVDVVDDHKDDMNIESISDTTKLLKVNTELLETRAVQEEQDSIMSVGDNLVKQVDNIMDQLPNIPVESEHEIELKSLDEVTTIIEEDENMANQIGPSNDSGNCTDQSIEASSEEVTNDVDATNRAIDNITYNDPNMFNSTEIIAVEKPGNNLSPSENLNNESGATIIVENIIEDSDPDKNSENTAGDIHTSTVEVNNQENTPKPELTIESDKNVESECINDKTPNVLVEDAEKINTVEENNSEHTKKDDANVTLCNQDLNIALEVTHGDVLHGNEENENKEDNEGSTSTSLQGFGSVENNDDSSLIESDLSKTEDDMPKSDNKNGQNKMDLETAAETIQKVFRSFLFKSRNSTFEDITNDDTISLEDDNNKHKEEYYATANVSIERRPLGITRMDTVLQTVNEEKSLSLSTDDSSTLSSAATTIQAHVRGFLVRNRLNSYKTVSTNSLVNSNEILDTDNDQLKNKTVLNIHIVPEEGNYLSRDESLITSMDLSLDESPPSSINLHPLSYDLVSERRKLLKREDAIQSVSPPSNNSGKLSEDSVKEILLNENDASKTESINEKDQPNPEINSPETLVTDVAVGVIQNTSNEQEETETAIERSKRSISPDESDVVTPFAASPRSLVDGFENTSKLIHSGEFHDVVLPTKVSRSDTTVVREFKNVLVYILLWNNS